MKTAIATIFTFLSLFSFSQTNIKVFSEDGTKFSLVIEGQQYNTVPQSEVIATNIFAERIKALVIFADASIEQISSEIFCNPGTEATYFIKKSKVKGKYSLIFRNETPLSGQNNMQSSPNKMTVSAPPTSSPQPNNQVSANSQSKQGANCSPMSNTDFQRALNSIKSKTIESEQVKIAKQICSSNCLSAEQIKNICFCFINDESKLEIAKFAYKSCSDKQNYPVIYEAFTFSSSVDEMNNFIGQ